MAVREVFVGGEMDSLRVVMGTPAVGTSAANYDTDFSACGIDLAFGRVYEAVLIDESGALTSIPLGEAIHGMFFFQKNGVASGQYKTIYDINGRACYRVSNFNGDVIRLEVNSSTGGGEAWQVICSSMAFTPDAKTYVAYYFDTGASKEAALFVNGSFASSGTFSNGAAAAVSMIRLGSFNQNCHISQIMVTENKPTVGSRVWTRKATANGAVQEMTGTYTSLVKTALNDTTSVVADAANETATYAYQDITTPVGLAVGEAWLWSRATNDGASPTNLKGVALVGSTNYTTANMVGMQVGFNALPARFPVNPATSTSWTDATFNAAEFGMQSAV